MNTAFNATLLSRVEDASLNASAPPQQRWVDGWLVRFSAGKAKRARCINAVAEGRLSVAERLAACEQVYAAASLPMIVRITPFTQPPGLDEALASLGFQRFDDTRVMVLADLHARPEQSPWPLGATLHPVGLAAFAQTVGALRGSPLAQRQAHAERAMNAPVPFSAFELHVHGQAVACGQVAIEGDLVGVYDVFTAPAARGQGWARALCTELLRQAQARGARHAYLQAEGDNHAARSVYRRLGLADGYAYHYRARDPGAA